MEAPDKDRQMTASQMIDDVKELLGVDSDYALEKALGMRKTTIQQARKNGGKTAPWKLLRAVLSRAC